MGVLDINWKMVSFIQHAYKKILKESEVNMRIRIKRKETLVEVDKEKGTYKKVKHAGGHYYPLLACPKCGRVSSLRDHKIKDDGEVSPSVVCGWEDCDFHDWIILEDWQLDNLYGLKE